ncbi:MAG: hypothetical protein P8X79_06220, partial [Reinekea sp.]
LTSVGSPAKPLRLRLVHLSSRSMWPSFLNNDNGKMLMLGPVWELLESDPNFETTFEFNDDRDTVIELIKNIESAEWVTLEKSLPDQEDLEDLGDFLTPHLILLPSEEYLPSFQLIYRQRDETELQISVLGDGYNRVEVSREAQ